MAVKQLSGQWNRKDTVKSILFFLLHTVLLILLIATILLADKLSYIKEYMQKNGADYLYALFAVVLLLLIMYFYFLFEDKEILRKLKDLTMIFSILDFYFVASYYIGDLVSVYARPVALVGLMVFTLSDRKNAIFMNIVSALLVFIIDTFSGGIMTSTNEYYSSLIIAFSAGMIAIFLCSQAKTRFSIVGIGILIVFPIDLIVFLLELSTLIDGKTITGLTEWQSILLDMGFGLCGGVMSAVLFLTILPLFEFMFNRLTVFRLREMTSSDAKILKKLKEEAPGTYNHSVMVAQLAEACALAIGENADYARAAALYHDVGKLHHPEHFTENQVKGEYNLHDELSPELSADIIRSHALGGYTLIQRNHLPQFFADVAVQHHGTMPIRYFYAKALKLTDAELNIEDFSYLGPKPQTKIAAIIMIADAAEATVRAQNAYQPEQAEKAIRSVIEERMDLEQFSECDITMVDLTKIRHALVHTLTGVKHKRIEYPPIKYKRTESGTKGEN
jgi:putative nucleotidyltransferase with HDIG domain